MNLLLKRLALPILAVAINGIPLYSQGAQQAQQGDNRAEWKVAEVDGRKVAREMDAKGNILEIYREKNREVWMRFQLSPQSLDSLKDRIPVFRVDDNDAVDIDPFSRTAVRSMFMNITNRAASQMIDGGKKHDCEPRSKSTLCQILNGKMLTLRYYLETGESKDAEFPLSGVAPIIAEALGPS